MSAFIAAFFVFAVLVVVVMFIHNKRTGQNGSGKKEKPDVEYVCTRCDDRDCDCDRRDSEP